MSQVSPIPLYWLRFSVCIMCRVGRWTGEQVLECQNWLVSMILSLSHSAGLLSGGV